MSNRPTGRSRPSTRARGCYPRILWTPTCGSGISVTGRPRGLPGVTVPLAPFLGVMGVALAEPGEHSTVPPRGVGGNMDVKQLTVGSTLLAD